MGELNNGVERAPGGKRRVCGRKPKAATILRRQIIENKLEEAEASFAFLVSVRNDEEARTDYRLEAAKEILNRVLGKANQTIDIKANVNNRDVTGLSDDELERIASGGARTTEQTESAPKPS